MEQEYSAEDKQQMIAEYERSQKRLYLKGKVIVFAIATMNIIGAVVSVFFHFNIVTLAVQIALSIALFCGISWVRCFFAIGEGLSCFLTLYLLFVGIDFSSADSDIGKYLFITYLVFLLLYSVASCIVLFASKSVSAFLYAQKNG